MPNTVCTGETVGFSRQLCCVYTESVRCMESLCKAGHGLTYNQLTTVLALREANAPATASELADYMMLRRGSVWDILSDLEEDGLVAKGGAAQDARFMSVSLSAEGASLADRVRTEAIDALRELYWGDLPERDFTVLMTPTIKNSAARLRGHAASRFDVFTETDRGFSSGFLVFWQEILSRWDGIASEGGLGGLGPFRILDLLREHTSMSPRDIGRMLVMPKATVSHGKALLVGKGFAKESPDPFDGRSTSLAATPAGRSVAGEVHDALDRLTREVHGELGDVGAATANAWHYFMYSRLMARSR